MITSKKVDVHRDSSRPRSLRSARAHLPATALLSFTMPFVSSGAPVPASCDSVVRSELVECMSERLESAERALRGAVQGVQLQLDPEGRATFDHDQRRWIGLRDSECAEAHDVIWPGREAVLEQLSCLEQATMSRALVLGSVSGFGDADGPKSSSAIRFSCTDDRGKRISLQERGPSGIGQPSIELAYEGDPSGSAFKGPGVVISSPLRFNHYYRFQTEYLEIAAVQDGVEYRVYRHFEGDFGEGDFSYGMVITGIGESTEHRIECSGAVVDHLSNLPPLLECDRENALGCGAFDRPGHGSE